MKAYAYQAALHCEPCGDIIRANLESAGRAPLKLHNESTWDSDTYPKGPYDDGGGEADGPQHCDSCGTFLENVLTRDGDAYVRGLCDPYTAPDDGDVAPWSLIADRAEDDGCADLAKWIRHYFAPGM